MMISLFSLMISLKCAFIFGTRQFSKTNHYNEFESSLHHSLLFVFYCELIYQKSFRIGKCTLQKGLDKKTNFFFNKRGLILGPCV